MPLGLNEISGKVQLMGLLNQLLQLLGSLSENLIALLGGKQTQLMGNCSKNSTALHFWDDNCSATFETELPNKGLHFHLLDFCSDF